ncbi:MAG: type 1 glutamine amidotransferase [Planctomycetaceae bacterium]
MLEDLRYLLLQSRNLDDPMRTQEVACFARALETTTARIGVFDLISTALSERDLENVDVVLLGGSGHYSVTENEPWLDRALDSLRVVYDSRKPTFASCWGFQALAKALGGRVIKDLERAEIGTQDVFLTEAGLADPVFGTLGPKFRGQMGHEDHVVELPRGATRLAYSEKVANQAYRFDDRPIYCTQFHPELNCADLQGRIETYPEYIERIAGLPVAAFRDMIEETPETEALLKRFVQMVVDG